MAEDSSTQEHSGTLVIIPTYQEALNIATVVGALLALRPDFDILVVDDSSPDGTGEIVREIGGREPRVHLLSRPPRSGIGGAHRDGILWAYQRGYRTAATMDADLTHAPADLSRMLDSSPEFDVVVASRFTAPGSLPGWSLWRRVLTWSGHLLTRSMLGMPYDATGALRVYRISRIPRRIFELASSNGYAFIFESLLLLHVNGWRIHEVPVILPARILGSSKMSMRELRRSVTLIFCYFILRLVHPERLRISQLPALSSKSELNSADQAAWDRYWSARVTPVTLVYDVLAGIYRSFIIRPPFERSIRENFAPRSRLLHAGCGSGMVDIHLVNQYQITALDQSRRALELYVAVNGAQSEVMLGNIEHLSFSDSSFEGVYNLGVMEHLAPEAMRNTLREFARVVKPGGKIVLWWPPEFGFSVFVLKTLNALLRIFRLNREENKLFPDEIARIRNRKQVESLLNECGLDLLDFRFGAFDLFTQVVVIAEKTRSPRLPDAPTSAEQ